MSLLKYMSWITTCSVFAALISIIWQAFLLLRKLNKATNILMGMLAIEASIRYPVDMPKVKVALGYGACSDLVISATEFLTFPEKAFEDAGSVFDIDDINTEAELLQAFTYYFKNGAAAERNMPNSKLFKDLILRAKIRHRDNIQWYIGGNAPLMGIRFFMENANVLLGARMSHKLRRLLPDSIQVAGERVLEDDIHLILEYKAGDKWGSFEAPRANRFILHNDQNNPHLNSIDDFDKAVRKFKPNLLVISGLQMMDSYKFEPGVRENRIMRVQDQLKAQPKKTLSHFEMASYVEKELVSQLQHKILPYVDSIGMNEQELENLRHILQYDRTTFAADWNPRVATTLDHMRFVFKHFAQTYYADKNRTVDHKRLLSRIHVHTLAYQALLTVKSSKWKLGRIGAAKAALTAYRYVCQTNEIAPEPNSLILDDSFATSANDNAYRIKLDGANPIPCWNELIKIDQKHSLDVELCVAPVLVCRIAKKTAGAGDNISAAALAQQVEHD